MTADRCSYAQAGTYGHECGQPATLARAKKSEFTRSGTYWARRCAECATYTGRENWGLAAAVPLDPAAHVNEWK
jgi:hypothetical protein